MGKLFYTLKKLFFRRYTFMIAPHQAGRVRSISIGLPSLVCLLGVWSLITSAGFAFFAKGGELWSAWAEAQLYKARVKTLALEVSKMREMAEGLTYLKEDLKILLAKDSIGASGDARYLNQSPDTLSDLLAGKISRQSLERLGEERRAFASVANYLLKESGDLVLARFDQADREQAVPSDWPTIGALTSYYGTRESPFHLEESHVVTHHRGVDIANIQGTPIRAAADGVVRQAGWMSGYGRTVIMDHGFGYSSLYGHTSRIIVSQGDHVRRGQVVAYMGTTGRSTGSHLHFEIWQHGRPVNPLRLVRLQNLTRSSEGLAKRPDEGGSVILFPEPVGGVGGVEEVE